jgi:hypothetical protein
MSRFGNGRAAEQSHSRKDQRFQGAAGRPSALAAFAAPTAASCYSACYVLFRVCDAFPRDCNEFYVFSSHSRPVNRLYFNFSRQLACPRQLAISSLRALLSALFFSLFFSLFAIVPAPLAFFQPAQGVAL